MSAVLVTGASKGIGATTAVAFAAAGFDVAVHYRFDRAGADATVAQCTKLGRRAVAIAGTGRSQGSWSSWVCSSSSCSKAVRHHHLHPRPPPLG